MDNDDPLLVRRRQLKEKARRRRRIIVGAALACLVVAGLTVAVAVSRPRSAGGRPEGRTDAEQWNHRDLLEHMQKAGMKVRMAGHHGFTAFFYGPKIPPEYDSRPSYLEDFHRMGQSDIVLVRLHENAQQAKDAAGVDGDRGWNWSRFSFQANYNSKPFLKQIQAAVTGQQSANR